MKRFRFVEMVEHVSSTSQDAWRTVDSLNQIPEDLIIQLAVLMGGDLHVMHFACKRQGTQWRDTSTSNRVYINPTHWREWQTGDAP
jgi:hypothetical protein